MVNSTNGKADSNGTAKFDEKLEESIKVQTNDEPNGQESQIGEEREAIRKEGERMPPTTWIEALFIVFSDNIIRILLFGVFFVWATTSFINSCTQNPQNVFYDIKEVHIHVDDITDINDQYKTLSEIENKLKRDE